MDKVAPYTNADMDRYVRQPKNVEDILNNPGLSRREFLTLTAALAGIASAYCGSSPTSPTNPSTVTLQVYNATTGQRSDKTYEIPSGSNTVIVNAADLAQGLGDVVTSEFAVRNVGTDNSLGSLVMSAGQQANIRGGTYQVFVPATAIINEPRLSAHGQSVYECMPNPSLNNGKRDFIVGVLHKPGVDPNDLPMYVWTDAIDELNRHMQSDSGRRYGSIKFDPNAANPDLTVGFANEINPAVPAPAWAEGYKHAYMMGPKSVFPLDYYRATPRDGAIEELFEMIFQVNNICNAPGTREVIGKALETNDREWGLNAVGVNLLRRNFTRAR